MSWIIYSLIAALGFGVMSLIVTYLTRLHIAPLTINIWSFINAAVLFLLIGLTRQPRDQLKVPPASVKGFALLAVVAVITNYFSVKALATGPNTGIVRSILMVQILVAAVGAYFFFHQSVSVRTGLGAALVAAGLILIVNK